LENDRFLLKKSAQTAVEDFANDDGFLLMAASNNANEESEGGDI
jgi:hypothetical protein